MTNRGDNESHTEVAHGLFITKQLFGKSGSKALTKTTL